MMVCSPMLTTSLAAQMFRMAADCFLSNKWETSSYHPQVLQKIMQREKIRGRLIIPSKGIARVFLRLEHTIRGVVNNPRSLALLGNQAWKVVKLSVSAADITGDLAEELSHLWIGAAIDSEIARRCAATIVRYYVEAVRPKDAVRELNTMSTPTDRVSFRHRLAVEAATRLMTSPIVLDVEETVDDEI
jgi:hypothetical protein